MINLSARCDQRSAISAVCAPGFPCRRKFHPGISVCWRWAAMTPARRDPTRPFVDSLRLSVRCCPRVISWAAMVSGFCVRCVASVDVARISSVNFLPKVPHRSLCIHPVTAVLQREEFPLEAFRLSRLHDFQPSGPASPEKVLPPRVTNETSGALVSFMPTYNRKPIV